MILDGSRLSPIITSPEILEFANRVLHPITNRLSGKDLDKSVSLDWTCRLEGDIETNANFTAELGEDEDRITYGVTFQTTKPISDEWSPEFLLSMFNPVDFGTSEVIAVDDTEYDEVTGAQMDIDLDELGYQVDLHSFTFVVPRKRCELAVAKQRLSINFLDTDYFQVGREGVYDETPEVPRNDLLYIEPDDAERMMRDADIVDFMFEESSVEQLLHGVTVFDLQVITGTFKSIGLISALKQPLTTITIQRLAAAQNL